MGAMILVSDQVGDPYLNLAVELYLVEHAAQPVLYLWRNDRTVVIGQNQNPYSEVDLEALAAAGGHLMRRRTGGGAVYHDVGNLNFSFIMPHALYDQGRQFAVIQRAVEGFGLHTLLSGRNDILAEGLKFSGNAFSKGHDNDLHHGTLLVSGNMSDLAGYLRPNAAKLQRHGVQSVRSRVVNLHDLCPQIGVESLAERLQEAFAAEYSWGIEKCGFTEIASRPEVGRFRDELASDAWLYGRWRSFRATRTGHFPWGSVEVQVTVDDGVIRDVQIASDALDTAALDKACRLLTGARADRLPSDGEGIIQDLIGLISE